jgi:hypothetical protein
VSPSRRFATVVLFGAVSAAACQRPEDAADLLPPAGFREPSIMLSPTAKFGEGWYPIESSTSSSWRWMAKRGAIEVKPYAENAKLSLVGWAPLDLLAAAPTLSISVNGHEIDRFVAPDGRFTKEYIVPAAVQQGGREAIVELESSTTAKAPGDARALGFSLVSLTWRPEK